MDSRSFLSVLFVLLSIVSAPAQDSLTGKLIRQEKRYAQRQDLKQSHERFILRLGSVFANLDTEASFEFANGLLSANVGLEQNLSLPQKRIFFTGAMLFRATPRSGIYALYYGINRKENYRLEDDITFLGDTIPAGTESEVYFNTQVLSAGYLVTVLKDPRVFLGTYFNVYLLNLGTGVRSGIEQIDLKVWLTAPLPNFGVVTMFNLTRWMSLDGSIGFFALHTKYFGGSIYNLDLALVLKPVKWLGFTISYKEFDIKVSFPSNKVNTEVKYNFRGPAAGLVFKW